MAVDFIQITNSQNMRANTLSQFVGLLRQVSDVGEKLTDYLNHMAADPQYGGVEGAAGLGVPAGTGQTVYNLVVAAYARINDPAVTALIARVGE